MKRLKLEINYENVPVSELSDEDRELVEKAFEATKNSYAKYSHFHVGAALRLKDGRIIIGANQENAAFPSGLCAERTAVFAAQANYPDQPIMKLAIASADDGGYRQLPCSPCGACRQVILEIEDRYKQPIEMLLCGTETVLRFHSIKDLLPLSFVDSNMR